ncbi:MAG: NifU family protein [Rickettsia sp.]|nr:NifU family protein [Rickettsia sp.]
MFIQTENTPNHNALKFLPGITVNEFEPLFLNTIEEAYKKSSLAVKLFRIEHIKAVFLGSDFITITKDENIEWEIIKPEILMLIMDHILAEEPFVESLNNPIVEDNKDYSVVEKEIIEIIETRIRPAVAMDGGDIVFRKFEKSVVYLELRGACSGCPSSTITLKQGIESMLTHFIPEVQSVEAIAN